MKRPMRSDVRRAREAQREAANFRYTGADVARLMEKKGRKTKNFAAEKQRLDSLLAHARERGDDAKVERCLEDLERLEKQRAIAIEDLESRARATADLNKRNVDKNFQKMIEVSKGKKGALSSQKSMEKADPFSRRPTAPMNYWTKKNVSKGVKNGGGSDAKAGGEAGAKSGGEEGRQAEAAMAAEGASDYARAKFPGLDLDFTIDVSLLDGAARRSKLLLSSMQRDQRLPKDTKTLSISDYFKRLEDPQLM